MSATKLIIHKYDGLINFKTRNVLIPNEDDCNVQYSEWQDDQTALTKKNSEKSARLVVKLVSGYNYSKFNLDVCAKVIDDNFETYINKPFFDPSNFVYNTEEKCMVNINKSTDNKNTHLYNVKSIEENKNMEFISKTNIDLISDSNYIDSEIWSNTYKSNEEMNKTNTSVVNPLENSLEKVRKNNARIMENINILNRTLYFTKKKETLNIFSKSIRTFPCNTCGKCFVYETGLRKHYSVRHAIADTQPRWQVVWTCIQCFQVWPRQDQAIKHSRDCFKCEDVECVREIKTSLLLQCEFCEKVFTNIPRLLRHSKSHTTLKNYECNACGITFLSYKIAERHWLSCSWLKMYYRFSLPKLLLCNACDRKFRNYDQLYNHRYKVGHFMTKTHCIDVKSLGVLVYQCEMCGQSFGSILSFIAHKSQCHTTESNNSAGFDKKSLCDKENQENYYMPAENEYDMTDMMLFSQD